MTPWFRGNPMNGRFVTQTELNDLARECGLDGAGVARAEPPPVDRELVSRLVSVVPADLQYLRARLEDRLSPGRLLPGVRSVVVAFLSYAGDLPGVEALPRGRGFVSRFAWGRDYHEVVGGRVSRLAAALESRHGARTRWYVDTGPVFEKAYAVAAGLGFIGKNSLFIHPRYGSFVFLGTILTNLDVPDPPVTREGGCARCSACRNACPVGALDRPYVLDTQRCLARVLVSDRSPPAAELAPRLHGNLFGCDLCQDVCPYNRRAERPLHREFVPFPGTYMPRIDRVLRMDAAEFQAVFGPTPVRRRPLALLQATARCLLE